MRSLNVSLTTSINWRLVCKRAKNGIDDMFEKEAVRFYNSRQTASTALPQRMTQLNQKYSFKNGERVQKFLSHFGATSSRFSTKAKINNPFLSRSLHLSTQCEEGEDPKVVNPCRVLMLENFGHHIHNITFHISGTLLGDSLIHFRALLPLVPNLKCLKIVGCAEDWVESEEFIRVVVRLPNLEQLEVLDVEGFKEEFSNFLSKSKFTLNELLVEKYGPCLKTLICGEELFKRENVGKLLNSALNNLKTLRLAPVTHSNTLMTLSEIDAPELEELEIWGEDGGGGCGNHDPFADTVFGQDFIRAVNNFAASLAHLKLHEIRLANETLSWDSSQDEHDPDDDDDKKLVISEMPKLTTLTMQLSNLIIPWFWNPIRLNSHHLEELTLTTYSISRGGLEQLKQEFGVFSKLKRIVIHCAYPEKSSESKKIVLARPLLS